MVLDCGSDDAKHQMERVRKWAFGDYSLTGAPCKVALAASIGLASWKPGDTMATLLDRADKAMYEEKHKSGMPGL